MIDAEKNILIELAERIDSIRKKKDLAQDECGVNGRTFRRILKGEHNPTILVLYKIANALEVNLQDLIPNSIDNPKKLKKK
jgi:transcriptional regulator with XRE-family HTH domain